MAGVKTEPVTAVLVDSVFDKAAPAGSIKFYRSGGETAGFNFRCPCGCELRGTVNVTPGGWDWNGSRFQPTVRPSVLLKDGDGPHWHGWLSDGVWESC